MTDQTIFRRAKDRENPYVMIDRDVFQNDELSWKAKGLLGYLLSRPDDWIVRMADLANQSTDGMAAVRSAVKELEDAGYMIRARTQDDEGKFEWTVEVHELPVKPSTENHHMDEATIYRLSIDGLSTSGKPLDILSTDHTNKEEDASASVLLGEIDDIDWHTGGEPLPKADIETFKTTGDPMLDIVEGSKLKERRSVPDWAIRGAEGLDPYYPALAAFCKLTKRAPPTSQRQGKDWLKSLGETAGYVGLAAKELADAIGGMSKLTGADWYLERGVWSSPRADSFKEKLSQFVGQTQAGTLSPANVIKIRN